MELPLTIKTRWEYLASVVAGIIVLTGVMSLLFYLSFENGKVDVRSPMLWFGVVILLAFIHQLFSIRSIRKSIVISEEGVTIHYLFDKTKTFISFSDVVEFKTTRRSRETVVHPARTVAYFTLELRDGNDFSFDRSEFDGYEDVKNMVFTLLEKRKQKDGV